MKFELNTIPSRDAEQFEVCIDKDGDLLIKSGDAHVLYISAEDGKLHRSTHIRCVNPRTQLNLDEQERLKICEDRYE